MLEQKYTENQLVLHYSIIGAQSQGASSMIELYNSQSSFGVSLLYHRRPACFGNVRAKVYWKPIGAALLYHNNQKAS